MICLRSFRSFGSKPLLQRVMITRSFAGLGRLQDLGQAVEVDGEPNRASPNKMITQRNSLLKEH
jgi:hypothetical protein